MTITISFPVEAAWPQKKTQTVSVWVFVNEKGVLAYLDTM